MEQDISTMDMKEAFYYLQSFLDQTDEKDEKGNLLFPDLAETYKKIRYGLEIKFDVYDYLNGVITIKSKIGVAIYRGKPIELSKLWDELEERTIVCRKWLKENINDDPIVGAYR